MHFLTAARSMLCLSSLLLVLPCLLGQAAGGRLLEHCGFTAIYCFGDSTFDSGNALAEFPGGPMGRFPYGVTIHRATGRFSDGYTIIDRIAEAAGVPPLNPYLKRDVEHSNGANFAVGGVGLLSKEARAKWHVKLPFSNSSVDIQLKWFDRHLNQAYRNQTARRERVESSLLVLGGAGNDYANINLKLSSLPRVDQMKRIMPDLLAATQAYVKKLITEYGARKVVVPGIFKVGCMVMSSGVHCDNNLSSVAALHNQLLQQELERLREEFPGVRIVYGDMWGATEWLFDHFRAAGIHHPNERCCGNSSIRCGMPGAPYCGNPSDYINWDDNHSTDHAYRIMSDFLIPQLAAGLGCGANNDKGDSSSSSSASAAGLFGSLVPPFRIFTTLLLLFLLLSA
ncbi:unnamed protein product [Linum tenue]|uniref:GDSL esterase/lipase n=1 Tax=Linum tenue TaxID=586396 RepID=A0AAV0I255_9ROSI|nr:unnamed protein product [Linum tenue]